MSDEFSKEVFKIWQEYLFGPQKNCVRDEIIKSTSSKIILFGAGLGGHAAAKWIKKEGGRVFCFCDSFKEGRDDVLDLPIISPKELKQFYPEKNFYVIVSVGDQYRDEITSMLLETTCPPEKIIPSYFLEDKMTFDALQEHIEGFHWMYDHVEDDISRNVIINRIRNYLFYYNMPHDYDYNRYFDPAVMTLGAEEIFLDGGVYNGDTIRSFLNAVKNKYKYIWGFEPDKQNYQSAVSALKKTPNVTLVNQGIWESEAELPFVGGEETLSHFSERGNMMVSVTALDHFFAGVDELPTVIKLDIQGAEPQAIRGAYKLIKEHHPKLILCIYHEVSHLYEVAQAVLEIDSTYRFRIRHYSDNSHETILYAT